MFKKVAVVVILVLLLSGCGRVAKETGTGSGGSSGGSSPVVTPRQLPIDRSFTIVPPMIMFTDTVTRAAIQSIEYDATVQTPNITIRISDTALVNKSIDVRFNGWAISFAPQPGELPTNYTIWTTNGNTSSTVICLNSTGNVFDRTNPNNYVELWVDNVFVEKYFVEDFFKAE